MPLAHGQQRRGYADITQTHSTSLTTRDVHEAKYELGGTSVHTALGHAYSKTLRPAIQYPACMPWEAGYYEVSQWQGWTAFSPPTRRDALSLRCGLSCPTGVGKCGIRLTSITSDSCAGSSLLKKDRNIEGAAGAG